MITYRPENIPYARTLRKEMTRWERKLWYCFLNRYPVKFRRQQAIGAYVADFLCARAKLIVELDGIYHKLSDEQAEYDMKRQRELEAMGFRVLRFRNRDVEQDFRSVKEAIHSAVCSAVGNPYSKD